MNSAVEKIELYRELVCDNGKTYIIYSGSDGYTYSLYDENWKQVNRVYDYYLEDSIKYNEPICVGRFDNGELEYSRVLDVRKNKAQRDREDYQKQIENIERLTKKLNIVTSQ